MKKILLTSIALLGCLFLMNAQDLWTPVIAGGLGHEYNRAVTSTIVFNGKIYAGTGNDSAYVYSSTTGDPGTWQKTFEDPGYVNIDAMAKTAEGSGRLYLAEYTYQTPVLSQRVLKSTDGINWLPYYNSAYNRIKHIIAFNGTGTVDSTYIVVEGPGGDFVLKSSYDSNDPDNLSGTWDTVIDFNSSFLYEHINCISECNNKLFIGTSHSRIFSSADGTTWTENTNAGIGFSNPNNYQITAIGSLGGYIYAGTQNYIDGAQIWRSNDEITWDSVMQFSSVEQNVTALNTIGSNLWVTTYTWGPQGEKIYKSANGTTYVNSNNNGFGYDNNGTYGNIIAFGNNIYSSSENYFPGFIASGIGTQNNGGQIWRLCNAAPIQVTVSPSTNTYCGGLSSPPPFTASSGFSTYMWDNFAPGASNLQGFPDAGQHFLCAVDVNGCSSFDTVTVSILATPYSYISSPEMNPAIICKGDILNINSSSNSGMRNNLPPFSSTNSVAITDASLSTDSIIVSGVSEEGVFANLVSITIDSLYHTEDGDLYITLFSPSGSYLNLAVYNGTGTQNYIGTVFTPTASNWIGSGVGPFTGSYIPYDPFSNLYGYTNGTWKLQVYDNNNLNQGFLKGWSLNFSVTDTNMTYSWLPTAGLSSATTANTIASPPATITYSVTITNSLGCSTKDSLEVEIPALTITPAAATVCYGSSATLSATGGTTYFWTPATSLSTTTGANVVSNATADIMYYVADTVYGCPLSDSVFVTANPLLSVTASLPQTICYATSAALSATATGGTPGYTYGWDDASSIVNGQNISVTPLTGTSYTLTATDANGCTAYDNTSVSILPSTNVTGHVSYSGGSVTAGNVVAFKYIPTYTHFDTVQVAPLDASGNFLFSALNSSDYILKVFADTLAYPTLLPTYYGNKWAWDSATIFTHGCSVIDNANIVMIEQIGSGTGTGMLTGTIYEGIGFGSHLMAGEVRAPGEPIPGIDVKLGKNPGGAMVTSGTTDPAGVYTFTGIDLNAPGEHYTVYVDIPGLGRDSSYNVTMTATTNQFYYLDYLVDSTTIYIIPNSGVGINSPGVVTLEENKFKVFPNPSKGNSTIEYTINSTSTVSLSIYNVLGVKVSELVNSQQDIGGYKYSINEKENKLKAGVYFITLNINNISNTTRLVIID
ncbi:MAG: T9SS type A sorting domain-containing protein [Bacteroidetes bacterium]|nr:T9SS type A sorting domain-containing protein [Bacteroidota bacterium]